MTCTGGKPRPGRTGPDGPECGPAGHRQPRRLRALAPKGLRRPLGRDDYRQHRHLRARRRQFLAGDGPLCRPRRGGAHPGRLHLPDLPAGNPRRRAFRHTRPAKIPYRHPAHSRFGERLSAGALGHRPANGHLARRLHLHRRHRRGADGADLAGYRAGTGDKGRRQGAIALNSLGINISRAIGPALGGALLAAFGAAVTYGVDIISYVFVVAALVWWRRKTDEEDALSERFFGAFRAGLRYARSSRELHVVLVRAAVFFAFSSAVWALLPLVARNLLGGSAGFYGILLGAVGAGAIGGAFLMPLLRTRLDIDGLMLLAAIAAAVVMAALSFAPPQWLAIILLLVLGAGWITALTTLNGTAQAVLPNWVRGRSLAIYLTVFNGAMTAGSLTWGTVAEALGIATTLLIAAVGLLVVGLVFHRLKLPRGEADLVPSNHWPEPLTASPIDNDRGPVLITVEYRVDAANRAAFLKALHTFSAERRRDGAFGWGVTEDAADPDIFLEWFFVESWAEHLRQHRRISKADADLQQEVRRFHKGDDPPVVRHLLATGKH